MIELHADGTKKNISVDDGKALSCLVKSLLSKTDSYVSITDISSALGITSQSFRNKLTRNSFSVNDLLIIADMVGAAIEVHTSNKSIIKLELQDFLSESTYNNYKNYLESSQHMTIEKIKELSKSLTIDDINYLINELKNNSDQKNTP